MTRTGRSVVLVIVQARGLSVLMKNCVFAVGDTTDDIERILISRLI